MRDALLRHESLRKERGDSPGNAKPWKTLLLGAAFGGFMLLAVPGAWANDVAVVLNKNVNVQSVTTADLVKICKGDLSHWPNGQALTLVMLEPESPTMKVVNEKIYKLTPPEVRALLSTNNRAPANHHSLIVVASAAELVRVVASKPGAIGLVDVYSITSAVSVAKVDDKLPLQPGYCLHGN